ncbi:Planctomycete cytochrome C [Rubripirellula tenax]|uniref:Planctomycete cytochrome C n=1 Tax=Rubripirellula tenax TaxID=2528015 RepID=A0A5C6FCX3_9BACT|nr:PSD1 and planctomycete cytochrome C domain-containing protein [Rubripirellula tenax]TWU58497.1 Planctomycete cytochrome C [Rubripirellula tenax]
MSRRLPSLILIFTILSFASLLADQPIDFVRDVEPILRDRCLECHGPDDQNGGLRFDRADASKIGDSGKHSIVAGKSSESELISRVISTREDDRMPPDGERLTSDQIDTLRRWIDAGAEWKVSSQDTDAMHTVAPEPGRDHWAFQPIAHPLPPDSLPLDAATGNNPIDGFIVARRSMAGLHSVPPANAASLIQRATYGLTGLPPTTDEVDAFVARSTGPLGTDAAFTELVDDLLARPTYGQRWGRHWMDWVRYADTAGDNSDFPIPQAYLYRNYIIDSMNNDLPYDLFLTQQLAGDLLPSDSQDQHNRQTIATGYLAMARRFGSLVERYPWHLTIEDTIDNVGRTMMGITIACARCHDHKFDPISTRDYYGLYGIFASTRYPVPGLELFQVQHDLVPLVDDAEVTKVQGPFADKKAKLESELAKQLAACRIKSIENAEKESTATLDQQRKMHDELDGMLGRARGAGVALAKYLKEIPELPMAYAVADNRPANANIQIKGEPDRPGTIAPRKFLDVLGGQTLPDDVAGTGSGRLQLAAWITSPNNPLTARVIVNRIWQRHFGVGLVSSTSDFGLRGQLPTHPELLDWLATDFIRHGWSLKHLHRRILSSQTYQLSSQNTDENLAADPENHVYWKFNRQRLDAESIRDTLLMLSGDLDPTPQDQPYPFPPRSDWTFTQHHPFNATYESNRRSVYQMTKRLTAATYMQTFDGADPNVCTSKRDQSVTALQALYFMNDEFLHDQAAKIAGRVVASADDERQRVAALVSTILGRHPSDQESDWMRQHLQSVRKRFADSSNLENQAWSSLTLSLLQLNEFIYLD